MLGLESPGTDGYVDGNGAALTLGGAEPDLPVKNASLWDDWGLGSSDTLEESLLSGLRGVRLMRAEGRNECRAKKPGSVSEGRSWSRRSDCFRFPQGCHEIRSALPSFSWLWLGIWGPTANAGTSAAAARTYPVGRSGEPRAQSWTFCDSC